MVLYCRAYTYTDIELCKRKNAVMPIKSLSISNLPNSTEVKNLLFCFYGLPAMITPLPKDHSGLKEKQSLNAQGTRTLLQS